MYVVKHDGWGLSRDNRAAVPLIPVSLSKKELGDFIPLQIDRLEHPDRVFE